MMFAVFAATSDIQTLCPSKLRRNTVKTNDGQTMDDASYLSDMETDQNRPSRRGRVDAANPATLVFDKLSLFVTER
jgi:hypothetical protein